MKEKTLNEMKNVKEDTDELEDIESKIADHHKALRRLMRMKADLFRKVGEASLKSKRSDMKSLIIPDSKILDHNKDLANNLSLILNCIGDTLDELEGNSIAIQSSLLELASIVQNYKTLEDLMKIRKHTHDTIGPAAANIVKLTEKIEDSYQEIVNKAKGYVKSNPLTQNGIWIFCGDIHGHKALLKNNDKYSFLAKKPGFVLNTNTESTMIEWTNLMISMGCEKITSLGMYDFNRTKNADVTFDLIEFIKGLNNLSYINLSGSKVSTAALESLLKGILKKKVKCLILDKCTTNNYEEFGDIIKREAFKTNLEHLSLEDVPVNNLVVKMPEKATFKNSRLKWISLYCDDINPMTIEDIRNAVKTDIRDNIMKSMKVTIVIKKVIMNEIQVISYPEKASNHDCDFY